MKICYEELLQVERMETRLEFITSELECPVWMLGSVYRDRLAVEARSILRRMSTGVCYVKC
jgi:hypothetical protein